jgi:hypothetical protein
MHCASLIEKLNNESELILTCSETAISLANKNLKDARPVYMLSFVEKEFRLQNEEYYSLVNNLVIEISYRENISYYFGKSIEFIGHGLEQANSIVIVNCSDGTSHSATIVIAYLMSTICINSQKMFDIVKSIRPIISLSDEYLQQLKEYAPILAEENQLKHSRLSQSIKKGDLVTAKTIVRTRRCGTIKALENETFRYCAEQGQLEILKLLVSREYDPRGDNDNALCWAAYCGRTEVVKYLVELGCDPRTRDDQILKSAAEKGHFDVVKYAINQGCDPTKQLYRVIFDSYKHTQIRTYIMQSMQKSIYKFQTLIKGEFKGRVFKDSRIYWQNRILEIMSTKIILQKNIRKCPTLGNIYRPRSLKMQMYFC